MAVAGGSNAPEIRLLRALRILQFANDPTDFVGCAAGEIEQVRSDQGVEQLPDEYVAFLRTCGKRAGQFGRGSAIFFPYILGLKAAAIDNAPDLVEVLALSTTFVCYSHQDNQFAALLDITTSSYRVVEFDESGTSLRMSSLSWTDWIINLADGEARMRDRLERERGQRRA